MKKIIAIVIFLCSTMLAFSQISIPGTHVKFKLDPQSWRYLRSLKTVDESDIYIYCYTGEVLTDEEGDTIIPLLRIYVNDNYDGDLYSLVYDRYTEHPYQSLQEYNKGYGLPKSGGLGYVGAYTSPQDQKNYQFYMNYMKDRKTYIEFRLETTTDTFDEMKPIFQNILNSIKIQ